MDNGNSFESCLQFEEVVGAEDLTIRIKVYAKTLAWLQSRTAMMTLGMNTNQIFSPSITVQKVLQETQELGYSRVEISYLCHTQAAFGRLFNW